MTYWGYHLILDASKCVSSRIQCATNIKRFSNELVKRIDMVAYGDPQIVKFGTGNKAGYTLVQLIETSNICAHFVDETSDMYLDVFSCKPFNPTDVEAMVGLYFGPKHTNRVFLTRQAPRHYLENGITKPVNQLS
uniref:S-adenosylmethionine decarboxylase n=1 Tax=viral metagenome TaxID=1070528 RepID=A0A6C0JNW8_9ZZZZ